MSNEPLAPTAAPETQKPADEPRSPTERLAHLEQLMEGIVQGYMGFFRELRDLQNRTNNAERVLGEAMQFIYGIERCFVDGKTVSKESLQEAIVDNRIDAQKAEIKQNVDSGVLKAAEVTTAQSLVVFRGLGLDGTVTDPRNHVVLSNVKGDMQEKFLDKKVGDLVSVLPEHNIEILEIYDIVSPTPPEEEKVAAASDETSKKEDNNAESQEASKETDSSVAGQ